MKPIRTALFAAALALAATAANAQDNAQEIQVVRGGPGVIHIQMPNGAVISVHNAPARPWFRDPRIAQYHRYEFDPEQINYIPRATSYLQPLPYVKHYSNNLPCSRAQAARGACPR